MPDRLLEEIARLWLEQPASEWHPRIGEIRLDSEGGLWIQEPRQPELADRRATTSWYRVGEDGRILGRLALPTDIEIEEITEDAIYSIEHGDFDVPYVVRYPIHRGAGPTG